MNVQTIVSFTLVCAVLMSGIMLGAPLAAFLDGSSAGIFLGVVAGGILWSHSMKEVLDAFRTFLGTTPVSAEQAQRDHRTFMHLARLSTAVTWIGPLVGTILIFKKLHDPSAIGPGMAIVLLTIFYGTAAGELLFRPAAAACLSRTGPPSEPFNQPVVFHPKKLLSVLLVCGLVAGLALGGTSLDVFIDIPSLGIVLLGTTLGLFVSHSVLDVRQVLKSVFGPAVMHSDQGERGAAMFHRLAELAVAIGFLGNLIGMIQMLQNLTDPFAIGPALAVSLQPVLYGAFLSEAIFRPAATDCLKRGEVQAEEWQLRHPNRTAAILGPILLVVLTWALLVTSFGLVQI